MIRKWYGIVLATVLGACLFLPGLEGRWLLWVANLLTVCNVLLAILYRFKETRKFKAGIREILQSANIDEDRNGRDARLLVQIEHVIIYNDMVIFVSALIVALVNWTNFVEAYFN